MVADRCGDAVGSGRVPNALGLQLGIFCLAIDSRWLFEFFVEPATHVGAARDVEIGVYFPIGSADEFANRLFTLHNDRQGGRLHTAHSGQEKASVARIEGGHGSRAIDAHQPIGFRPAACGVCKRQHLRIRAQIGKAVPNGLWRHRLQPQTLRRFVERLFVARKLFDQAKNQLALAASVTGIDEIANVLALRQFHNRVKTGLGFLDGAQIKARRQHGQIGETPLATLHIKFFGCSDLHQVADGRGDDVCFTLKVIVVLIERPSQRRQRRCNIFGHRRLFRND